MNRSREQEISPINESASFLNKWITQSQLRFGSAFKKVLKKAQSEEGSSDTDTRCLLFLLVLGVSAAITVMNISQQRVDDSQNQKIAALQTAIARLSTPTTEQASEQMIVEVSDPRMKVARWYQGEITIRPLEDLELSIANSGTFSKDRQPENLVNWENILEINGIPVRNMQPFTVVKLLLSFTEDIKKTGNPILDAISYNRSKVDLIALKVRMRNRANQLERRYAYFPANPAQSIGSVESYNDKGPFIILEEQGGKYYLDLRGIGNKPKEIPADQIGRVTFLQ